MISTCLNIVLSDDSNIAVDSGSDHSVAYKADGSGSGGKIFVPAKFCSAIIKLTALQMHSLGVRMFTCYFSVVQMHSLGVRMFNSQVRCRFCSPKEVISLTCFRGQLTYW